MRAVLLVFAIALCSGCEWLSQPRAGVRLSVTPETLTLEVGASASVRVSRSGGGGGGIHAETDCVECPATIELTAIDGDVEHYLVRGISPGSMRVTFAVQSSKCKDPPECTIYSSPVTLASRQLPVVVDSAGAGAVGAGR